MRKMSEYYKVLHFLKFDDVDRIFPCQDYFLETDPVTLEEKPTTYSTDDRFLFQTNKDTFTGLDYVSILLESSEEMSTEDLQLNFSEFVEGYAPYLELKADEVFCITPNVPVRVNFTIEKLQQMSDEARNLTGIQSIELLTSNNLAVTLYDIAFKHDNATYTLELLDMFIENGKYYITSRLHLGYDELPEELEDHVYTAAAGYAWMSVWEFEARVMNDEQKNAKSYGKWLFADVDTAIENYKKYMGIDEDEDYVIDDLTSWQPLKW